MTEICYTIWHNNVCNELTHWPLGNLSEIFRFVIFKRILMIVGWGISCKIALIWMSLDLTDDQSTLVQDMAWCLQVTSHYLSQCWPRSVSPYGITWPQWVKLLILMKQLWYICTETFWVHSRPRLSVTSYPIYNMMPSWNELAPENAKNNPLIEDHHVVDINFKCMIFLQISVIYWVR